MPYYYKHNKKGWYSTLSILIDIFYPLIEIGLTEMNISY